MTTENPPVRYFGPRCGYAPGGWYEVVINGRTYPPAQAGGDGCVSVTYYGPACGYPPGQWVAVVINGRAEPPAPADADGCVSVTR